MSRARNLLCILLCAWCVDAMAKNGAYKSTGHGDRNFGPQRKSQFARGSCIQCHDTLHSAHEMQKSASNQHGLFAPDDNDLCFTCHAAPSMTGLFPGTAFWQNTTHARSASVYLSGANPRPSSDANKCVNCHDPHGMKDKDGVIPAMLVTRDSALCLTCHNGSRGTDTNFQATKNYRHPFGITTRHSAREAKPEDFAAMPRNNRHVDCSDCHNAHRVDADPAPPFPPQASNRLAGVSRVLATYGGAGSAPTYLWRPADDPGQINEFEICFKCHSSYTTQPPGQSNLALLTNPDNPSFHPIQTAGKNPRIDPLSFAGEWNAQSLVRCSDCHASDDGSSRGPHGSSYKYILKKQSTTTTDVQTMDPTDICFDCHAYGVYADPKSPDSTQRASRFNMPSGPGHAYHVGVQHVTCYGCHETHGSTRRPALIATRFPGMTSYTQTPSGGTCTQSCHAMQTYTVTYPR